MPAIGTFRFLRRVRRGAIGSLLLSAAALLSGDALVSGTAKASATAPGDAKVPAAASISGAAPGGASDCSWDVSWVRPPSGLPRGLRQGLSVGVSTPLPAGVYRFEVARTPGNTFYEPATISLAPCFPESLDQIAMLTPAARSLVPFTLTLAPDGGGEPETLLTAYSVHDGGDPVETGGDLLARYAPVLRYDLREEFLPYGADLFLDASRLVTRRGDTLSLDAADSVLYRRNDTRAFLALDNPSGGLAGYRAIRGPEFRGRSYPPTVYAASASDPARPGWIYLQYWLLYVYDDWVNVHEGDWERVTVILDPDGFPRGVAFAQHEWAVPLAVGEVKWEATHPVVYVALGSHASYPDSGSTYAYVGTDEHPGDGRELRPGEDGGYTLAGLPRGNLPPLAPGKPGASGAHAGWLDFSGGWGNPARASGPALGRPRRDRPGAPRGSPETHHGFPGPGPAVREGPAALSHVLTALSEAPSPELLRGPRIRPEWILPHPALFVIVAWTGVEADFAPPAWSLEGPEASYPSGGDSGFDGVLRTGDAYVPSLEARVQWMSVRDWAPGGYTVRVEPGGPAPLVGLISWGGLTILAADPAGSGDHPFSAQDPAAPEARRRGLSVAPNPVRGAATLYWVGAPTGPYTVELFDVRGRRVARSEGIHGEAPFTWEWNGRLAGGAAAPAGVYFARVRGEGRSATARFVRLR